MRASIPIYAVGLLLLISQTFAVPVGRESTANGLTSVEHTFQNTVAAVASAAHKISAEHGPSNKPRSLFRRVYPHTAGHLAASRAHADATMAHALASKAHTDAQTTHTTAGRHVQAAISGGLAAHHTNESMKHVGKIHAHSMNANADFGKDHDYANSRLNAQTSIAAARLSAANA